jgi:hypothetical protein
MHLGVQLGVVMVLVKGRARKGGSSLRIRAVLGL